MNIALWIVQIALALLFFYSGGFKSTQLKEKIIAAGQTGVYGFSLPFIRFIAICELFGAVGLILPWLLGVAPVLTPLAAVGLAIIMVGAGVAHAKLARANQRRRRRELANVATNVLVFTGCLFVAIVRLTML